MNEHDKEIADRAFQHGLEKTPLDAITTDHLNRQDIVLTELKGENKELRNGLEQIKAKVTETNGRVTRTESKVVTDSHMLVVLSKGFEDIEKREEERVKEAHEDRKALKNAVYAFCTALIASGLGALLIVLFRG